MGSPVDAPAGDVGNYRPWQYIVHSLALELPVRDGVVELIGLRDAVLLKLSPSGSGKIC
jgi:hypothetical protein